MRDERTVENLRSLGDRGRASSEAAYARWYERNPTAPCPGCFSGSYVERAGVRRPFRSEDFSAAAGDRYEASCQDCRGAGKVFVTPARAAYLARRELREQRRAYRALRAAVCSDQGLELAHFDRLVRKRLPVGVETPAAYLVAARAVADFFSVSL